MNSQDLENKIKEKGLNAPRVTLDSIQSKIKKVEYQTVVVESGKMFMYCYITMENGFEVSGDPSVCVSQENFNEEIGKKISYDNSFKKIWPLEAYLLTEKLSKEAA